MLFDFAENLMYLFSFLPSPVSNFAIALVSFCTAMLFIRLIITIKNMIPFL